MTGVGNQFYRCIIVATVICLLILGFLPKNQIASAENPARGWKENITLTGSDVGEFTLDSNTSQMLFIEDAVPGDVWEGEITFKNKAGGPMEVSLLSISNKLDDDLLFKTLDLDIWIGEDTIYAGKYGETPTNVTPYYVIPAGSSMKIDVRISFPPDVGNIMQGKAMDSSWTFEARYAGNSQDESLYPYRVQYLDAETKEQLMPDKHGYASLGNQVTEFALAIAGYKPDASKKSITVRSDKNLITFYYKKADNGAVPDQSEPPSETPSDSVRTGEELMVSNTTSFVYVVIAGLSVLGILITWLKILAVRNRMERSNNS